MGKRSQKNYIQRIRLVCKIVQEHYEPGNQTASYKEVWRRYVNPVYPMCYHTLLRYISKPIPKEDDDKKEDTKQLTLF